MVRGSAGGAAPSCDAADRGPLVRCAIYTRKNTEEGSSRSSTASTLNANRPRRTSAARLARAGHFRHDLGHLAWLFRRREGASVVALLVHRGPGTRETADHPRGRCECAAKAGPSGCLPTWTGKRCRANKRRGCVAGVGATRVCSGRTREPCRRSNCGADHPNRRSSKTPRPWPRRKPPKLRTLTDKQNARLRKVSRAARKQNFSRPSTPPKTGDLAE